MSSLTIEERFTLDASPSDVWSFLIDPERVVACLPGAALTKQMDERTYEGAVNVSLGAVTVSYRGTATFEETDHERRFVRIVGRGREKSGSGTVSMTMESRVEDAADGGAAVSVTADVKVAGKIVRFGRGMIESVSAEMFADFTKCLETRLGSESGEEGGSPSATGAGGGDDRQRRSASDGESAKRGGREERTSATGDVHPDARGSAAGDGAPDSIALLPLLWRSFKRWLSGIFR